MGGRGLLGLTPGGGCACSFCCVVPRADVRTLREVRLCVKLYPRCGSTVTSFDFSRLRLPCFDSASSSRCALCACGGSFCFFFPFFFLFAALTFVCLVVLYSLVCIILALVLSPRPSQSYVLKIPVSYLHIPPIHHHHTSIHTPYIVHTYIIAHIHRLTKKQVSYILTILPLLP